ncbi:MAG: RNA polymerase sigma factor [Planctomycetes bacterium]|nr:RNA polymerase sigma factor [Planctomycetota bacterium]
MAGKTGFWPRQQAHGRSDIPRDADDSLLAAFARGDGEAFGTLFHRHRDFLARLAHLLCGDFVCGEELVRRSMVRVFRSPRSHTAGLSLRLGLMRELVRHVRRLERRQGLARLFGRTWTPRAHRILPVHRLEMPARGREGARGRRIVQSLAALPLPQREAVALCDFEGLSYEEAAAVLRRRPRTVGLRLARGRLYFSAAFQRFSRR